MSETATERTVADQALATEAPPASAPAPTAPATNEPSAAAAPAAGGHSYGASLAEFTGEGDGAQSAARAQASPDAKFIEWGDLIPPGAAPEEVFARFEEQLEAVEIGSPESSALYQQMQAEFDPAAVNPNLDGQKVWLAGFVAPLTYDDDIVTEFLFVPTFGACIHVPPPPPNQTIMVSVDRDDGLTVEDSWGAVWVEGTLTLASTSTDLADTSYTITGATSGVYTDL